MEEIAPAAGHQTQPLPARGDGFGHRLDRNAGFEDVVQIEIAVAQPQNAEPFERRQQRLPLVRRRRDEHLWVNDRHYTAGNSSDFWYAELTVSGMPQYLNSE